MSISIANHTLPFGMPRPGMDRVQAQPHAGATGHSSNDGHVRAKPFVRGHHPVHAARHHPQAKPSLGTAARQLAGACGQRHEALVNAGAPKPEYLGTVNTDHARARCGASRETFVYRHPSTGDVALLDMIRPNPGPSGKPRPLQQTSALLVKADGRVFHNGREIVKNGSMSTHASNRVGQVSLAVAENRLERIPRDIATDVALPWSRRA